MVRSNIARSSFLVISSPFSSLTLEVSHFILSRFPSTLITNERTNIPSAISFIILYTRTNTQLFQINHRQTFFTPSLLLQFVWRLAFFAPFLWFWQVGCLSRNSAIVVVDYFFYSSPTAICRPLAIPSLSTTVHLFSFFPPHTHIPSCCYSIDIFLTTIMNHFFFCLNLLF